MKKINQIILQICFVLFRLICSTNAFSQEQAIRGKLIDDNNQPVPGATIKVKGSKTSTITDVQGKFSISAKINDVLVVSIIGFNSKEFKIDGNNLILNLYDKSVLELTEEKYKQLLNLKIKNLFENSAFSKNAKRIFFSDPTLIHKYGNNINSLIHITPIDSDGDGLSDSDEIKIGTDPRNPDTDGDGLLDGWEVGQINGIDLKKMGASPLHKDIFVQMDFMIRESAINTLGPNANVINGIEKVFRDAPITNPDGIGGISIHLILGKEVPYVELLDPVKDVFIRIKKNNFDTRRGVCFHYMIWANAYHTQKSDKSSGLSMDIPSSDFIVTLGKWNENQGGADYQKIGSFVHELGHNLGLYHGDSEDVNYKPNHFSVMNYAYQVSGVFIKGVPNFNYQPFDLPDLDENNLNESIGLNNYALLKDYQLNYLTPTRELVSTPASGSIDWNYNGVIDAGIGQFDLNGDGQYNILNSTPNEWKRLVYTGGTIGQSFEFAGLVENAGKNYNKMIMRELTEDLDLKVRKN